MLKAGLAWHYKQFDSNPIYAKAEEEARAARRGLWQDKNPIEPHEFRKAKRAGR
jgi:endonuclease YncB( thermonuclease family)